jgi:hypothetical protein
MLKNLLLVVLGLSVSVPLYSQVAGSAQGPAHEWHVGAEYSRLNPDYWAYPTVYMNGLSLYVDFNDFVRPHYGFGVEGTWRTLLDRADGNHKEDSYLVSGRFVYRYHLFQPFIKGGGGLGDFSSKSPGAEPVPGQNGVHVVGAVGAGLDVRLTRRVSLRPLEWEQQVWSFSPHLLGPHSYSFGAAYRFH